VWDPGIKRRIVGIGRPEEEVGGERVIGAEELDVGFKGFEAVGKEFGLSLQGGHCGRFRRGA
jgi:hypothetical protein